MLIKSTPILIAFLLFSVSVIAQTYSISGTVKDKNESLPSASIYLANSKIATQTNGDGRFSLNNLPPGNYQVLVQMIGYNPYSVSVSITNQSVNLSAVLTENIAQLNEVSISVDPNRKYHLTLFKRNFLGITANSYKCKLLNPEVLRTYFDKKTNSLKVTASDYLLVENRALGYTLKFLLEEFEFNKSTEVVYYQGYPFYTEMKGSANKKKNWKEARKEAYYGSIAHFFRSLYQKNTAKEGFIIHKVKEIPNKKRQPENTINLKIQSLSATSNGLNALTFTQNDSLAFWLRERSKPRTFSVIDRTKINADTLVHQVNNYLKAINFIDKLYILYKDQPERYFASSGFEVSTPDDLKDNQVSLISLMSPPIIFFANGQIQSPRSALFSGYWGYKKVADALPIDFVPPVAP